MQLLGHCLATAGTENQVVLVESGRRAMPRQNEIDRHRAIGMIQAGMRHRAVAAQFGVHINTAVSPDLAPIEHVCDEMQRRVRALPNQPVTLAALDQTLVQIWNGIPQLFFNNLVRSMRRRCQACIDANGGHSRY